MCCNNEYQNNRVSGKYLEVTFRNKEKFKPRPVKVRRIKRDGELTAAYGS